MYSATGKKLHSAAWRVSLWGTLCWAVGTLLVFVFLHHTVAMDTLTRTDTWVKGEARTMSQIVASTQKDERFEPIIREIEEDASREMPDSQYDGDSDRDDAPLTSGQNSSVFFLQVNKTDTPVLWAGPGDVAPFLAGVARHKSASDPFNMRLHPGEPFYRVSSMPTADGGRVYIGLSERAMLRALHGLLLRFMLLWLLCVGLGFAILFVVTRRVLSNVRNISLAASSIGEADLHARVPVSKSNDEVRELASTLNGMLDRIERSVSEMQTITGALAHDLRSPLTAIRAKLEHSLLTENGRPEAVEAAIEEIDRLTEILAQTLDVAEAQAGALRMRRTAVDLDALLRSMADLFHPSMHDRQLTLQVSSSPSIEVWADQALLHRLMANLFENALRHLPAASTVCFCLGRQGDAAVLQMEDDGPGFPPDAPADVFRRGVRGADSGGHGLGLAFVEAVARAHGGSVQASNRESGGARLRMELPLWNEQRHELAGAEGEGSCAPDSGCLCHQTSVGIQIEPATQVGELTRG